MFVHCLAGRLPEPGADADAVRTSTLPAGVRAVLTACLALPKSDRPASVADVLKALRKWCNAKMATEPMRYTLLRVPVAETVVDKATAVPLRTDISPAPTNDGLRLANLPNGACYQLD